MTIINAFHPDYVKTYHPNLTAEFRTLNKNKQRSETLTKRVEETRKTKPSHGTLFGISDNAVSLSPKEMMLKPKDFHIYSKA